MLYFHYAVTCFTEEMSLFHMDDIVELCVDPPTTSSAETGTHAQAFAVVPTKQPVIRSIVLQPRASSSSTGTNKRRLEQDDDYAKLIKCEIERVQVEKQKLELECRVLELKQILLQHKVDDIQK